MINEQNKTISELWDGKNMKCSFRRCVDSRMFGLWEEVVCLAESLELTDEDDEPIWQFQSSGIYFSQSLFAVINFGGVIPIFVPAV
jgi:hypothetical protein